MSAIKRQINKEESRILLPGWRKCLQWELFLSDTRFLHSHPSCPHSRVPPWFPEQNEALLPAASGLSVFFCLLLSSLRSPVVREMCCHLQTSDEKHFPELCQKLMLHLLNGTCTLRWRSINNKVHLDSVEINGQGSPASSTRIVPLKLSYQMNPCFSSSEDHPGRAVLWRNDGGRRPGEVCFWGETSRLSQLLIFSLFGPFCWRKQQIIKPWSPSWRPAELCSSWSSSWPFVPLTTGSPAARTRYNWSQRLLQAQCSLMFTNVHHQTELNLNKLKCSSFWQ